MTEDRVGILAYANSATGFTGILKHRFSDFQVNEVGQRGNVFQLSSLEHNDPTDQVKRLKHQNCNGAEAATSDEVAVIADSHIPISTTDDTTPHVAPPEESEKASTVNLPGPVKPTNDGNDHQTTQKLTELEDQLQGLSSLCGGAAAISLKAFMTVILKLPPDQREDRRNFPDPIFIDAGTDKEKRRQIHDFFKSPLFAGVETETLKSQEPGEDTASIRVLYNPPMKKRKRFKGAKARGGFSGQWPGGDNSFLQFSLYKENTETQAAISLLATTLRLQRHAFGFAGTKDKRACTVQGVTLEKIHPRRMMQINQTLSHVKVGDFSYVPHALHLGGLSGNVFSIILRNISGSAATIALAVDSLKKSGFINYFGLQRFGSEASPTHMIGLHLAKGEWEAAVKLIMAPREGERDPLPEARLLFQAGNVGAARKLIPPYASAESAILKALVMNGHTSYLKAVQEVPAKLKSMYINSLQSYLWNCAASHRIQVYGATNVVLGDLVIPRSQPSASPGETPEVLDEPASKARLANVHLVDEEDLSKGTYSIEDVVLPLPGSQMKYPSHQTSKVYQTEAEKHGLSLKSCPHSERDFSLPARPGDYRYILHKPSDVSFQLLRYAEPDQDLALTQLEKLEGRELKEHVTLVSSTESDGYGGKPLLGMHLQFQLSTSCYATMLLRELMKCTTDTAQHKGESLALKGAADQ